LFYPNGWREATEGLSPDRAAKALMAAGYLELDGVSQFTAQNFVDAFLSRDVKLSIDRRGAWRDNVFVERVWRN
jgi:hypothetical protein